MTERECSCGDFGSYSVASEMCEYCECSDECYGDWVEGFRLVPKKPNIEEVEGE
jgi:hypothetical protein